MPSCQNNECIADLMSGIHKTNWQMISKNQKLPSEIFTEDVSFDFTGDNER